MIKDPSRQSEPSPDKLENCHKDTKAQRKIFFKNPLCLCVLVAKISCREMQRIHLCDATKTRRHGEKFCLIMPFGLGIWWQKYGAVKSREFIII